MNTNENRKVGIEAREEVVELGVASVETRGNLGPQNEELGFSAGPGISEE